METSRADNAQKPISGKRLRTAKETDGYFNSQFSAHAVPVFAGTHRCSSDENVMFVTTLGSCIAVCIHDPFTKMGGINHFMMPDVPRFSLNNSAEFEKSTRYGLAAMEVLINDLMIRGVRKENMQFKLFGGGNVIKSIANIGTANIKFVHEFLRNEGYAIESEDTGGVLGRRIHFFPATGKAMRKFLKRDMDTATISNEELLYCKKIKDQHEGDDGIQLF